jgi:hypothetical protein
MTDFSLDAKTTALVVIDLLLRPVWLDVFRDADAAELAERADNQTA